MYLQHHGIKGQKWGVRRFQNADGSLTKEGARRYKRPADARIISKGTSINRISNNENDAIYDNKKYVSLTDKDHKKWQEYLGEEYARRGIQTYDIKYMTTKDLKIAPYTKLGELFIKNKMDISKDIIVKDSINSARGLGQDVNKVDGHDLLSMNLAIQTETGKAFVNKLLDMGYDGIEDFHGRNVADDPIIIFNPGSNLEKKSTSLYKSKRFN